MNTIVLNLIEAVVTLYPANADAEPLVDKPIWMGVSAENLRVADRWVKMETRPTGARYPRKHPLVTQYEVSVGRVWALPLSNKNGFIPGKTYYVLDIVWTEEDTRDWHRETYYNVTISDRTRTSKSVDEGFIDDQVFDAEYLAVSSGQGVAPAISAELPYTVDWVGEDGHVPLYRYDPATHVFNEVSTGVSAGRATLAHTPPDQSGTFQVMFAGDVAPALKILADGTLETGSIEQGAPSLEDVPRVEFLYGKKRMASVTQDRALFGGAFRAQVKANGEVADDGSKQLKIYAGGGLKTTMAAGKIVPVKFRVFSLLDVPGLKLWVRAESAVPADPALPLLNQWPDSSGNGHVLLNGNTLEGGAKPSLVRGGLQDASTLMTPDGTNSAAVYFQKKAPGGPVGQPRRLSPLVEWMQTAGSVIMPATHCIFALVMPFQKDLMGNAAECDILSTGGIAHGRTGNDFHLLLTSDRKVTGRFWTDGGARENTVTGSDVVYVDYRLRWVLIEQEVTATQLIVRVNGVDQGAVALAGTKNGASHRLVLGARETGGADMFNVPAGQAAYLGAMLGYVRCVLVYEGNPTEEDKAKVRGYLKRSYGWGEFEI